MRLLHIVTSPRGERSASVAVADAFIDALRSRHPDLEVDLLDVWAEDMPEFDRRTIEAKYKSVAGEALDEGETRAWEWITAAAKRFADADRIVLGLPMWNWAYPYKFKQLVDLVSQRDLLFTFDGAAFGPAVDVERALVIATRGQAYRDPASTLPESVWNHQIDFPDFFLRTIGVQDVRTLVVEHTWDDERDASIAAAQQQAAAMAADF